MSTALCMHILYTHYAPSDCHVLSDRVLVLLLSDVFPASQAINRFSIESLLNRRTAVQTPPTLLYWTTRAFSVGVNTNLAFSDFRPAAASFTSSFTSAKVFRAIVPDSWLLQSSMPSASRQCSLGIAYGRPRPPRHLCTFTLW